MIDHKRGVRDSVALILTLILLAKLAGMTTPLAIAEWERLPVEWRCTVLLDHALDVRMRPHVQHCAANSGC